MSGNHEAPLIVYQLYQFLRGAGRAEACVYSENKEVLSSATMKTSDLLTGQDQQIMLCSLFLQGSDLFFLPQYTVFRKNNTVQTDLNGSWNQVIYVDAAAR
jgi:hypothetical protein